MATTEDLTMNPAGCVRQPADLDWPAQEDDVVLIGYAAGVPDAIAEGRRRWAWG